MSTVSVLAVSMTIGTPDSVRIARQTSMPFMPGSIRSSSTTSGRSSRTAGSAPCAVADHGGVETLTAQHDGEHLGERRVVVDDAVCRDFMDGASHPLGRGRCEDDYVGDS